MLKNQKIQIILQDTLEKNIIILKMERLFSDYLMNNLFSSKIAQFNIYTIYGEKMIHIIKIVILLLVPSIIKEIKLCFNLTKKHQKYLLFLVMFCLLLFFKKREVLDFYTIYYIELFLLILILNLIAQIVLKSRIFLAIFKYFRQNKSAW